MALGQAIKKIGRKIKSIKETFTGSYDDLVDSGTKTQAKHKSMFDVAGELKSDEELAEMGIKLFVPRYLIKPGKRNFQRLSAKKPGKVIKDKAHAKKVIADSIKKKQEVKRIKGLKGKIQESLTGEKSDFQKTLSERKGNAIGEDGKTDKSLEYHLSRVGENAADFAEQTKGVKTMDDVRNLAKDKGIDIAENASDEDIVNAIQGHYSDRAKAEASFGDKLMAHKVPHKALGGAFTLGVAASLFTGDGKKSNADLYSSPY